MVATQSQASFAQGTHGLVENREYLKQVRSDVMCLLWKVDAYSCSPLVTMALLVPVQLDPEFGCIYEGLRTVMRFMRDKVQAQELRKRFYAEPAFPIDGPTARLHAVATSSILGRWVSQLMEGGISEDKWLHDLREEWRNFFWGRVSRERSQHYAGASKIDRARTLRWYNQLQKIADQETDENDAVVTEARAQMGVLRSIFAGGLMTPDRTFRRRNKGSEHLCRLERESVEHVTWRCMQYNDLRADVFSKLPCAISDLPTCV